MTGFQEGLDFPENPGVALGCAADHQAVGAGVFEYLGGPGG